ncbi:LamG domain-containing protein [Cellvibrio japonicus]|uniref:Putative lipoprotein n=1 Tax=Cellvibrio japonicus (strain Ueda107) TaxID=498211 RepID=B3PK06_CELJU|nr:LamG domain-containing protein [Cellvibrio japonicus]ACE82896.1 putative lipoprotein [Cellvibrio japonicus Ueda107]QEI12774.1 LamG domain-containing protein [Cellvibrio japonicus]QEI16348.1 LamG domain-containing protein [Cellvibrio japonicus]QEI19926.1 LamG domain-containing protein [Cellvibrio japonicus]
MKKNINLGAVFILLALVAGCAKTAVAPLPDTPAPAMSVIWTLDSLAEIGGAPVAVLGNPQVIAADNPRVGKQVVHFDGDGDRLLVDANPLSGATEFTIEILFKPNDVFPANPEPRFFHIEAEDNPNRRITIELRLNDQRQWYLDAYIKSELSQYTLIDPARVHKVGEWYHAAVTYQSREFISYVNGIQELTGEVDYLPIAAHAKTSIGSRMNQIHWFNGAIAKVAITPKRLQPTEFVLLGAVAAR